MFDFSLLDLSSALGLAACGILTLNYLLGMMLSTGYKTHPYWKKLPENIRRFSVERIHNWTAYLAISFTLLHLLFLFLDQKTGFTLEVLIRPLTAPKQPWFVLPGVIAFYALLLILLTTQKPIKRFMGFRFWKNIHLISYLMALFFLMHGLMSDPLLKDQAVDYLDAEKVFVEACMLLLFLASIWRIGYFVFKQRPRKSNGR